MRIILCVTNDIATDQRVSRIALSLLKIPADILLVGVEFRNSLPVTNLPVSYHRISMLFKRGPLFYMEYNIRLFFYLLLKQAGVVVANDLDTLLAVFLVSRIKKVPLVYDSHEYFTELPELVGRRFVKAIWEHIEAFTLPRIRYAYTVSSSIAADYRRKYGINMQVIRNLPYRITEFQHGTALRKGDEKLLIYQGALNMGRGIELAIRAMQFLENSRLIIAGSGYIENDLGKLVKSLQLHEKVQFVGRILQPDLIQYTAQADLGLSLEENLGLNYYYALPNKLFDYIQAHIPVLVSDLPEMAYIVQHYGVGRVISTTDPVELAKVLSEMLTDNNLRELWKSNLLKASSELCWEKEVEILMEVFQRVLKDKRIS